MSESLADDSVGSGFCISSLWVREKQGIGKCAFGELIVQGVKI